MGPSIDEVVVTETFRIDHYRDGGSLTVLFVHNDEHLVLSVTAPLNGQVPFATLKCMEKGEPEEAFAPYAKASWRTTSEVQLEILTFTYGERKIV